MSSTSLSSKFPDSRAPGAILRHQSWDRAPWNRWSFQHIREIVPTAQVWRGRGPVRALPEAHRDLDAIEFEIGGKRDTVSGFLQSSFTDGFLALHRGHVIAERYFNGMEARTPHLSQSVAKSIVGTLAGILIGRGLIVPSKPITFYLPELHETAYRGANVQHVLDMTSGVAFNEHYEEPDSHMARLDAACGWKEPPDPAWPKSVWELILTLRQAEAAHGASFRYRSIETEVLAFVLQRSSGKSLADLVSTELWEPMGAEEDAYFTVDSTGYALADGGFNATLRDYARFALLHLGKGELNGRQIVPASWIEETRSGDPKVFGDVYHDVLPRGAYRNQFWVEDPQRRAYLARGVFGQMIYIDPDAEFAAIKLSSWPEFLSAERSRTALAALHAIRDGL